MESNMKKEKRPTTSTTNEGQRSLELDLWTQVSRVRQEAVEMPARVEAAELQQDRAFFLVFP